MTLKSKKELHRQWKQQQVPRKAYRDVSLFCRDGVRKAEVHLQWMDH